MWINKLIIRIIYHLVKSNDKLFKDHLVYLLNTNLFNNYNHNLANQIYTETISDNLPSYNREIASVIYRLQNNEKLYGWGDFYTNSVRLSKVFINEDKLIDVKYNIKLFKKQYIELIRLFNKINKEEDNYNYRVTKKFLFYLEKLLEDLIKLSFK